MGCNGGAQVETQREISRLKEAVDERDRTVAAQQVALEECNRRLRVARAISDEDLAKIFYPETLLIEALSGGYDDDGRPGDDGVVVYLRPLDRDGDAIKAAGDIRIELFDLGMPAGRNLLATHYYPVEKARGLWYGKLMTYHYTLRCPWQHGPPQNPEVTVRATFVDYLTQRVMTAQKVVTVKLAPS